MPASAGGLARPQDRGDPQRQLARLERLAEVIVDADLEPEHTLLELGLGGQHQDRNGGRGLAVGAAHPRREGETVLARHHHVEHDEIEGDVAHRRRRLGRIASRRHAVALGEKIAAEQLADAPIVIDDKEMRGIVGGRDVASGIGRRLDHESSHDAARDRSIVHLPRRTPGIAPLAGRPSRCIAPWVRHQVKPFVRPAPCRADHLQCGGKTMDTPQRIC